MVKTFLENLFEALDNLDAIGRKRVKSAVIGAGIGFAVGSTEGFCLGELVKNYCFENPSAIDYTINICSSFLCGYGGMGIGSAIGNNLPTRLYKHIIDPKDKFPSEFAK